MGKTILLAGYRGFIGSHVKERLESLGHEVVGLHREPTVPIVGTPEVIINCAAELVDESRMWEANVCLVHGLMDLAVKWRIDKVIHLGSSSEYGPTNAVRREDMSGQSTTLYETTKSRGTQIVMERAYTEGTDACVVRPFSIYGPRETTRKLIPQMWEHMMHERVLNLCPYAAHDWLYIDDFVDGIVALFDAPREVTKGQIFNLGSGVSRSNMEVLGAFQEAANEMTLGRTLKFHMDKQWCRPYDVTNWQADITKAARLLNWRPKTSLRQGLLRYLDWRWFSEDVG